MRFHYYLRQIGVQGLSLWTSLRVFVGGFSLTLTPGKVGELIRIYWLKNIANADPASVAPSIIVDRVVDGLAMALLALGGILAYPQSWPVVAPIVAVLILGVIIIQIRPLALWLLELGNDYRCSPELSITYMPCMTALIHCTNPKKFPAIGLLVGVLAWMAEGVSFFSGADWPGVRRLAVPGHLLYFYPGDWLADWWGIELAGGSGGDRIVNGRAIAGRVLGTSEEVAVTAVLMIRFFTLWSGVGLGVLVVLIWRKFLFGPASVADATQPLEAELGYRPRDNNYVC
jgi:uncharacterized membrane protein YbhN (UPF0104 family)